VTTFLAPSAAFAIFSAVDRVGQTPELFDQHLARDIDKDVEGGRHYRARRIEQDTEDYQADGNKQTSAEHQGDAAAPFNQTVIGTNK